MRLAAVICVRICHQYRTRDNEPHGLQMLHCTSKDQQKGQASTIEGNYAGQNATCDPRDRPGASLRTLSQPLKMI